MSFIEMIGIFEKGEETHSTILVIEDIKKSNFLGVYSFT